MRQALSSSLAVWNEDGIECEVWVFFCASHRFPALPPQQYTYTHAPRERGIAPREGRRRRRKLTDAKNASLFPSSPTRVLHIILPPLRLPSILCEIFSVPPELCVYLCVFLSC